MANQTVSVKDLIQAGYHTHPDLDLPTQPIFAAQSTL